MYVLSRQVRVSYPYKDVYVHHVLVIKASIHQRHYTLIQDQSLLNYRYEYSIRVMLQPEEMFLSAILPIVSSCLIGSMHMVDTLSINVPQDIMSFVNTLPRLPTELDIIVIRKVGTANSLQSFLHQTINSTSCITVVNSEQNIL